MGKDNVGLLQAVSGLDSWSLGAEPCHEKQLSAGQNVRKTAIFKDLPLMIVPQCQRLFNALVTLKRLTSKQNRDDTCANVVGGAFFVKMTCLMEDFPK